MEKFDRMSIDICAHMHTYYVCVCLSFMMSTFHLRLKIPFHHGQLIYLCA